MSNNTDQKLDEVCLRQLAWKNQKMLAACLVIADKAVDSNDFYTDELVFDFLLTEEDRNCIGSCFRMLCRTVPIIEKTGMYRRSKKGEQNGRICWQYRLCNYPLAQAFLSRYNKEKAIKSSHPQLNLGL